MLTRFLTERLPDYPYVRYTRTNEVSHVGVVLAITYPEVRVMSDVWETATDALVWDSEAKTVKTIRCATSGFSYEYEPTVDATPEVLAEYAIYKAEQERLQQEAASARHNDAIRKALADPTVGHPAVIVKGRKLPVGTSGVVIWRGHGNFGEQVRLRLSDGTCHYIAVENVLRVVTQHPGESWVDTSTRLRDAEVRQWDMGRTASGAEGLVFYCTDGRVGISPSGEKDVHTSRYEDAVWCPISEVTVVSRGTGYAPVKPTPPKPEMTFVQKETAPTSKKGRRRPDESRIPF